MPLLDQQVPIWWSNINTAPLNCFAIPGMDGLELTRAIQYLRQETRVLSWNVEHYENRSWQVRR
jgi:hypothetical protein